MKPGRKKSKCQDCSKATDKKSPSNVLFFSLKLVNSIVFIDSATIYIARVSKLYLELQ